VDDAKWEIRLYQTRTGAVPFSVWFDSLQDIRTQQRIDARLARLRLGNLGDVKRVGEGIHELRLDFGPGYRIYFGQQGRTVIILLYGGDKSTQQRDIRKAKLFWADYMKRRT
jgi:putative addiction module killer protein